MLVSPPLLPAASEAPDPAFRLLRDAALMLLKEGNSRYVAGNPQHPHQGSERRLNTVADGQEPFATVLACSDSRKPVELIFDRGVGDLVVIRVAGNVAGPSELASVEYGTAHLNTPLLIVMGHSGCGAVSAVVEGTPLKGHLHALGKKIEPAAVKARAETIDTTEAITHAVQANVWNTIEEIIKQSSLVRDRIDAGRLQVVGAVYDLGKGDVSWLGTHPAETALIALANQCITTAVPEDKDKKLASTTADPNGHAEAHPNSGHAEGHPKTVHPTPTHPKAAHAEAEPKSQPEVLSSKSTSAAGLSAGSSSKPTRPHQSR